MLTKLKRLLYDEAYFTQEASRLFGFALAFLGFCFDQGYLPTGIDDGGSKIGRGLFVVALFVATSRKQTPHPEVLQRLSELEAKADGPGATLLPERMP